MKKISLTTLIFLLSLINGYSQVTDTIISREKLTEDFRLFRKALEEAHPGIYRYTSKDEFDKAFSQIAKEIDHDMYLSDFYKLTVPLVALLRCAHTKYMPEGVTENKYYFHTESLFPLKLYFRDGRAFLVQSISKKIETPPVGTEVLSINGKSVSVILNDLMPYIFVDGDVQSLKYEELNMYFNGLYADFVEHSQEYTVEFKNPDGGAEVGIYHAITLSEFDKKLLQPDEADRPYQLDFLDNTAILTISSFWKEDPHVSFKKFIQKSFKDIRENETQTLIIDVRNNEGGMDRRGALLYSYLTDMPFKYYKELKMSTNKKYSFEDVVQMPKPRWLLRMLIKEKGGNYYWTKHKNLKEQKPAKDPFLGKTIVLTNGRSMSVTSEFCGIARHYKRATFIGEETGGAYQGNNSGAFAIVNLPGTHLNLGIPLISYYMDVDLGSNNNGGIVPDHEIIPTVNAILQGRDVVMDYTLEIAK